MRGSVFIISAASGTGKTSLALALSKSLPDIKVSISYTTRPKRNGEIDDTSYFFIDEKCFLGMAEEGKFLEYAKVFNHYYGTPKDWVFRQINNGIDVILDIDWQGAEKIRQIIPQENVSVFLLPPSQDILRERLRARKRDDARIVSYRLLCASAEIEHFGEFDYLVVNDDFEHALKDLQCIVTAQRLKLAQQKSKHERLLASLLQKS